MRPIHLGWSGPLRVAGRRHRTSTQTTRATPVASSMPLRTAELDVDVGFAGYSTTVTAATAVSARTHPMTYATSLATPRSLATRRTAASTDHGWAANARASRTSVSAAAPVT